MNNIKDKAPSTGTPHEADGNCLNEESSSLSIVALLHTITPITQIIHKIPEIIAILVIGIFTNTTF